MNITKETLKPNLKWYHYLIVLVVGYDSGSELLVQVGIYISVFLAVLAVVYVIRALRQFRRKDFAATHATDE